MLHYRIYGNQGPMVFVLHGGPAAAGSAAPIARGLTGSFRVFEPWQRGSGNERLTVARHVADLHDLIQAHGQKSRYGLVGESWGAMLALAYAAAHPDAVSALALVGCGTFDRNARERMHRILEERFDKKLREQLNRLEREITDASERLRMRYELMHPLYDYDPIESDLIDDLTDSIDMRAHKETWDDMLRLQAEGIYPAAFTSIDSPVLMLHGVYDPHPGRLIYDSLKPYIQQLEYRELDRCGHHPWKERHAREEFFLILCKWLARNLNG